MSTSVASTPDSVRALASKRQIVAASIASLFGWGLDLFDLFILLYVAPVVGALFFPAENPLLSLAGAYASFAVTLLIRPLGSAIFGSYADRVGRRRALMIAVSGVGIATAIFGILPTVPQIGWAATALFLVFRLVQGVFVGGVVAASHTIGTESVSERWRGLMSGSVGGGGAAMGGLFASLIFYVVSLLAPGAAFAQWGWRVMFFSGLLTSIVGLVIFRNLEESPIFAELKARKATEVSLAPVESPLRVLFSKAYLPGFLGTLLLSFGGGSAYYLTSGYFPAFFKVVNNLPNATSSLMLVAANVVAAIGATLWGEVSQHIGRRMSFLIIGVIRLFAFPILFIAMGNTTDVTMILVYALLIAFIANASYGPLLIFLNERFPTALRATGTGLSWNVGFALGGILPTFISLIASSASQIPMVLAVFTFVVTLIYLIGAFMAGETRGNLDNL
jgi:MHS family proline/betaine transporter-like MFS transporter